MPTTKKPKTPLTHWPGGANPTTAEALKKNLVEGRKRLEECVASKSQLWQQIMENAEDGFLLKIVGFRDKAEQFSGWQIKLEALINKWEDRLRDSAASELIAEQKRTGDIFIYKNPPPWQQKTSGG